MMVKSEYSLEVNNLRTEAIRYACQRLNQQLCAYLFAAAVRFAISDCVSVDCASGNSVSISVLFRRCALFFLTILRY